MGGGRRCFLAKDWKLNRSEGWNFLLIQTRVEALVLTIKQKIQVEEITAGAQHTHTLCSPCPTTPLPPHYLQANKLQLPSVLPTLPLGQPSISPVPSHLGLGRAPVRHWVRKVGRFTALRKSVDHNTPGVGAQFHPEPRRQRYGQSGATPGAREVQEHHVGPSQSPGASDRLRRDCGLQAAPAVSEFAFAAVQSHLFECRCSWC